MAVSTYQISAVKSPCGEGFIGIAVGSHFDNPLLTLTTVGEGGNLAIFTTAAQAHAAMNRIMLGLASCRFKPATDITPENLGRAAQDLPEEDPEP